MLDSYTATKVHVFTPKWVADLLLTEWAVNTPPLKKSLLFALCVPVVITWMEIPRLNPASSTGWGSCLPITSLFQHPHGGNESYSWPKSTCQGLGWQGGMSSLAMFLCMELLIAETAPPVPRAVPGSGTVLSQRELLCFTGGKDSRNGKLGPNWGEIYLCIMSYMQLQCYWDYKIDFPQVHRYLWIQRELPAGCQEGSTHARYTNLIVLHYSWGPWLQLKLFLCDFKGSELSPHKFGPTGKFSQGATQTHECLPLTFWSWLTCALLLCKCGEANSTSTLWIPSWMFGVAIALRKRGTAIQVNGLSSWLWESEPLSPWNIVKINQLFKSNFLLQVFVWSSALSSVSGMCRQLQREQPCRAQLSPYLH